MLTLWKACRVHSTLAPSPRHVYPLGTRLYVVLLLMHAYSLLLALKMTRAFYIVELLVKIVSLELVYREPSIVVVLELAENTSLQM